MYDRLSMYTSTQVNKYNVKVDNQNNKTKFDSKKKVEQCRSTMLMLTTRFTK